MLKVKSLVVGLCFGKQFFGNCLHLICYHFHLLLLLLYALSVSINCSGAQSSWAMGQRKSYWYYHLWRNTADMYCNYSLYHWYICTLI